MAIGREFSFTIDLSPERLREGNSERQQAFDHFYAAYPLLFRQRELFKVLASESRMRHIELRNKGSSMRELDTGDLVVLRKQVKSSRKNEITQKFVFKTKGP